jgi:hypothetical protein
MLRPSSYMLSISVVGDEIRMAKQLKLVNLARVCACVATWGTRCGVAMSQ